MCLQEFVGLTGGSGAVCLTPVSQSSSMETRQSSGSERPISQLRASNVSGQGIGAVGISIKLSRSSPRVVRRMVEKLLVYDRPFFIIAREPIAAHTAAATMATEYDRTRSKGW